MGTVALCHSCSPAANIQRPTASDTGSALQQSQLAATDGFLQRLSELAAVVAVMFCDMFCDYNVHNF